MNKCEICNVYIENLNKERACAFEHNGDKDICPLDDRYIDLSKHDKQVRADAIDEIIQTLANDEDTILTDKQYYTLIELKNQK